MASHPEQPADGRLASTPGKSDLISMDEFETHQRHKLERLRHEVRAGLADMDAGKVVSGTEAFEIVDRDLGD